MPLGVKGVRQVYQPVPMNTVGEWEEILSASYPSPCFGGWLLPFQISSLGHKVLYTVYAVWVKLAV
jgi:hypothetical protein